MNQLKLLALLSGKVPARVSIQSASGGKFLDPATGLFSPDRTKSVALAGLPSPQQGVFAGPAIPTGSWADGWYVAYLHLAGDLDQAYTLAEFGVFAGRPDRVVVLR